MKLDEARVALRPRSMLELLDLGLRLALGSFSRRYLQLGLLVLLPAWGLTLAAHWGLGWEWPEVWALALALATVAQGVFTVAAGRLMFAEDPPLRELLGGFARRLPAYIATLLITRLALFLASFLAMFVVPLMWVWGRCAFVHEACLLEQAGPRASLERADNLVKGGALQAGLLMVAMSIAALTFVYIAEAVINVGLLEFVLQLDAPFGSLADDGGSAAALLGLFVALPYWSTVRFLAYIDGRTRRDGWDIQLRFMALASEEQDAEPGA